MNKWFKIGVIAFLAIGAVVGLASGVAFAQDDTQTTPEATSPVPWGKGMRGPGGEVGLEAAAQALGMTSEELSNQLWAGKTLADLAAEKGIDLATLRSTVETAIQNARATEMRTAIEQAVSDGTITQEHADWLLEGLEKGFLTNGFGLGHGMRGGHHGRGQMEFGPQLNPSGGA